MMLSAEGSGSVARDSAAVPPPVSVTGEREKGTTREWGWWSYVVRTVRNSYATCSYDVRDAYGRQKGPYLNGPKLMGWAKTITTFL